MVRTLAVLLGINGGGLSLEIGSMATSFGHDVFHSLTLKSKTVAFIVSQPSTEVFKQAILNHQDTVFVQQGCPIKISFDLHIFRVIITFTDGSEAIFGLRQIETFLEVLRFTPEPM